MTPKLHSAELEQSIIGAILIDPDTLPDIQASVRPESFVGAFERVAYTTIATIAENGSQIDFLTVSTELERTHAGHDWLTYLATVAKNVPSTVNVVTYAKAVRQYHYLRQLYQAGQEVSQAVLVDGDLSEKIAAGQKAIQSVLALESGQGPQDTRTALKAWLAHLETVQANDGVSGLSTGLTDLDDMTHGMKPGELHILAARPGQGKTILALQIGYHVASRSLAVLIFSLEMQARELISRLASCATGTYYRNIQQGDLDALQWENITGFVEKASKMNLHIDDRPGLSIDEIRSVARAHRNKHGVDLVIVDYLQLASGTGESDVVRVGSVSKGLKELAKELDCPVLALSQFNRGVEQRSDGRPKLSDLRSSGQIEQDADTVMMLHRIDDQTTELILEKNRHGRTGSVWLHPVFERMRFSPGSAPVSIDEPPAKGKLRY